MPDYSPDNLEEALRREFAKLAISSALECSNNADLMKILSEHLPSGFLKLVGTGSTRRVYATPLGVVLKVQREDVTNDPLREAEMEDRGGDAFLPELAGRRRIANLSEITFATRFPKLMPRHYGFLGTFGLVPRHPSVLISESAQTLDKRFPVGSQAIAYNDLALDLDYVLHVFDSRITDMRASTDMAPLGKDMEIGAKIWSGNLGVLPSGRYVFVDVSNFKETWNLLNEWTLAPREFGWTAFASTPEQDLAYSESTFARYENAQQKGDRMPNERPPN